jgi:hypothetical protein
MRLRNRHLNQRDAGATLVLDSRRISGLSDGNAVSQWDDASRSGWNVTQGTAGARPTYKTAIQGGQPVVRCDGGDRLINSSVSTSQTFSFLSVFQISPSDGGGAVIFDSYNSTQCVFYRGVSGGDQSGNFALGAGSGSSSVASANNNWNVAAGQFSASTSFCSFNGTKTTVASSIGTNGLSGISVGNLRGNPSPLVAAYELTGDVALVVLSSTALADPLRKRLERAAAFSFKISCN